MAFALEPKAAWNTGAEAWEEFVTSGADYYRTEVHGPALLKACGDLNGLSVLDIGCGQGYFSRLLKENGAGVVIGLDLSDKQIASAREHEARTPLGIDYRVQDATHLSDLWPAATFDLVTGCMSLMDMEHPGDVLKAARQVLKPRGHLVFSVVHPVGNAAYREWERDADGHKVSLKIDRYFESGPRIARWNMPRLDTPWETPYWSWTLAEWSETFADAGFVLRRLHEPRPTAEQVAALPDLEDCYRLPYFLLFDLSLA